MTRQIKLKVEGPPHGKTRPRFGNGRVYTDKATENAEARIERAWELAGKPRLPDGPIAVGIALTVDRPKGHFKKDGSLSAEGLRNPLPTKKPDVDNAVKWVFDALNGRAYRDDVQITTLLCSRRWSLTVPCTNITLTAIGGEYGSA